MHQLTIDDGTILFTEGTHGDAFFIVEVGQIDVFTQQGGERLVINQFTTGASFGEMSLVDQKPRSASAVAVGTTRLLRLDQEAFLAALQAHPQIAYAMLADLSGKLRSAVALMQQGAAWSRQIAAGEYAAVRASAKEVGQSSAELPTSHLIDGFIDMAQGVQAREAAYKQQLQQLQIEIDQVKRKRQVEAIVESAEFKSIEQKAQLLRARRAARKKNTIS